MDHIGRQFGNYLLVKELGRGGFAKVYLGEHVHLKTLVAIKVLDTRLIAREEEQFLEEARIIASLEHPSIVHVLDCGIEGEEPFLIMNYAPNGTLRQRHPKDSQVALPQIVSYVKQLASALYYAHERKFIHRDIKPENMLVGSYGEVLLADFGIALISSSSTSQSTKMAAGTVSYMAPEQIMGKPRAASDQYGLAVAVYEWLCGELPFHGSFSEVSAQHLHAVPDPLRERGIEVPAMVEEVVMKALAKDLEQRFPTILEFASALEESAKQTEFVGPIRASSPGGEQRSAWPANQVVHEKQSGPRLERVANEANTGRGGISKTVSVVPSPGKSRRNLIALVCLLALALAIAAPLLYTSFASALASAVAKQITSTTANRSDARPAITPTTLPATPKSVVATPIPPTATAVSAQTTSNQTSQQSVQPAPTQAPAVVPTQPPPVEPTQSVAPTQPPASQVRQLGAKATYSQTVNASGQTSTPGVAARAYVTFTVYCNFGTTTPLVYSAGLVLTDNHGIQIRLLGTASVPPGYNQSVLTELVAVGAVGNGYVFQGTFASGDCNSGGKVWTAQSGGFSGGQDAKTYPVVQQSDINGAAASATGAAKQAALNNIQGQMQSNEHVVGQPQCSASGVSNYPAGAAASTVTATVTVTCVATVST